ncbi:MAG TPA: hypothetical protein VEA79_07570 [Phenylobacterium sp.]|nr:hypothetical protein [Phenylobacterium sp.]
MLPAARVYDAVFRRSGLPAVYSDDETPATDCRVVRHTAQIERERGVAGFRVGDFGVAEFPRHLLVRQPEVATPRAGGKVVILDQATLAPVETWRIGADHPVPHDADGYVWRMAVVREDG